MINNIFEIIWSIPAVLIAITFHEYAHGFAAYYYGDPTAKLAGRLTLNPIAHLDPIGTIMLIMFRIGWAKPVPVNYGNLRNPRKDMIKVSLAGPISNILIAFLFSIIYRINNLFLQNIIYSALGNIPNLVLTLIRGWIIFLQTGILINLVLAFFNLIPVPPLDGHHIAIGILPIKWAKIYSKINSTYGMLILLMLIWTGIIGKVIFPIAFYIFRFLT
ncbi:MAG: site-2 protease family protein [Candidatus Caldatribacteriota bacterium]|jgi:Zn-dependent protease|nr:site-2 protease family protein [Atribacterota bacterium]MDD3030792.1 site-2 protease family protein [Atribacterota bacterium]MDD3640178.1 site-2 protease family protein [Atribacterota bacterium]MDD4288282.1 site-2 protease family protein [Atribacterota bacterium]MDD4764648.1 site-2 protease family protein [Atribacterota bacterium]